MKSAAHLVLVLSLVLPLVSLATSPRRIFDVVVMEFEPNEVALSDVQKAEIANLLERLEECGGSGYRRALYTVVSGSLPSAGVPPDYQKLGQRAEMVREHLTANRIPEQSIGVEILPRGPHRLDTRRFAQESKYARFVQVRAECMVQPRLPRIPER